MEFIEEEKRVKREIKGITDTVTQGTSEEVKYPVINIVLDKSTPRYKLQALSKLLKSSVKTDDAGESLGDMSISVALKTDTTYKVIGKVMPNQVKTLMSIIVGMSAELEREKGEIMDSMYIYALSN